MAQLGARLDGIEEVVGSNPIGSTTIESLGFTPGSRTFATGPIFFLKLSIWLLRRAKCRQLYAQALQNKDQRAREAANRQDRYTFAAAAAD